MKNARKVFCLGLSRTGTTSLCAALERLGLRTVHYPAAMFVALSSFSARDSRRPAISWSERFLLGKEIKAARCRLGDDYWEQFDAWGDLPVPQFFRELDARFPGSCFLYTHREIEPWLNSMEWMLSEGRKLWQWGFLDDEILLAQYGTYSFDREKLTAAAEQHDAHVRDYFRGRNDLLALDVTRGEIGLRELGEFLGIEAPDEPLPRVNEARPSEAVAPVRTVSGWAWQQVRKRLRAGAPKGGSA